MLCKLDSVDKVLALENVLHFSAGTSPDSLIYIAEHMNAVWEEKGSSESQRPFVPPPERVSREC